jgi:hypothetical protein
MIATAARFLLASVAGPLNRSKTKREVPAAQVSGVEYRPGLLTRVRVSHAAGRDIAMVPNRRADAERFAREFDHLINTGSLPG